MTIKKIKLALLRKEKVLDFSTLIEFNTVVLFFAVNRIISFTGHSKLGSSDKYSTYFQPNFAMKVGNYLYPSFYVSFYLWKQRNRIIYLFWSNLKFCVVKLNYEYVKYAIYVWDHVLLIARLYNNFEILYFCCCWLNYQWTLK